MSTEKFNIRNGILLLIIVLAASLRLLDFGRFGAWANFTPVGAIALFAGTYFKNKWHAYAIPLITLMITDWLVSYLYFGQLDFFYSGFVFVYMSFAAMVYIGSLIKNVNIVNVLGASIISVVIHWLLSDIEPWLALDIYPNTAVGYIQCLIAAIPFEKNLLLGNLIYGTVLYGGFEFFKSRIHILNLNTSH